VLIVPLVVADLRPLVGSGLGHDGRDGNFEFSFLTRLPV